MVKPKPNPIKAGLSHRRRVTRLKYILPALALFLLAGLMVLIEFPDLMSRAKQVAGDVVMEVEKMQVEGETRSGSQYRLFSSKAVKVDGQEGKFNLTSIRGSLPENNGAPYLTAPKGLYNEGAGLLDLETPVLIRRNDGLQIDAGQTRVILDAEMAQSSDGVYIKTGQGATLRAQQFLFNGASEQHDFSGRVHVTIPPAEKASAATLKETVDE